MARNVTGGNIGLSFLDVLASALGAAVLLFVILASTPPKTPTRAKAAGNFIRYEWRVVKDSKALVRIKIYPPGAPDHFYWIKPDETAGQVVLRCQEGASSILAVGFSPSSGEPDKRGNRTYVLRLNGIEAGRWRVGVIYYGRIWDGLTKAPDTIHVTSYGPHFDDKSKSEGTIAVIRSDSDKPDPTLSVTGNEPVELRYADELQSPIVQERERWLKPCGKS